MGNSCCYVVTRFIDFVNTSVPLLTHESNGRTLPPSSPDAPNEHRHWVAKGQCDYFVMAFVQGRSDSNKYVAEVGRKGNDKTYILKKQSCPLSAQNEFLAMSIAHLRNPHILLSHEHFVLNGVHYFVYEKEDIDMFTVMVHPSYGQYRRRSYMEKYIRQMTSAVDFLHSHRVIHNDIKLENMVLHLRTRQLRLIDFESCQQWHHSKRFAGTEDYMAPEILLYRTIHAYVPGRQDIWSLGMLFSILLLNKGPIAPRPRKREHYQTFLNQLPDHPFVQKCLTIDPTKRIDIHALVDLTFDSSNMYPSTKKTTPPPTSAILEMPKLSSDRWTFSTLSSFIRTGSI